MYQKPIFTDEQKANLKRMASAMRKGAAIRPQATGRLFREKLVHTAAEPIPESERVICSCALGAAWEGTHPEFNAWLWIRKVDAKMPVVDLDTIARFFNLPDMSDVKNPRTGAHGKILNHIVDLNDIAFWPREAIADWLAMLAE